MRYFASRFVLIMVLAPLLPGCRLPWRQGPVSRALARCRELSHEGVAALERGRPEEAKVLLAEAVDSCPDDPSARRHYAQTLWQTGAHREAVIQLEEATRLAPEDATLWVCLAEMQLAIGQLERARQCAEHAIDLDPRLATAWAIRGRVMRSDGRPREALSQYHRALDCAPGDCPVLLETAELYYQLNRPQRALAALHGLADRFSPGDEPQRVLHLMGLSYVALGRYEEGVDSLSAAVTRGKPTPEILCHLGEAQALAGQLGAAAAAARHALALQPEHRPSRELLGRLQLARVPQSLPRR